MEFGLEKIQSENGEVNCFSKKGLYNFEKTEGSSFCGRPKLSYSLHFLYFRRSFFENG